VVSHLVTRREIPFDVPVVEALTQDNVRANVDCLVTFNITDPFRFIYNISAGDFDQVLQAVCQDTLRSLIRQISSEQVVNLARQDTTELQATLSAEVEPYGVTMRRVTITYAQPAAEIMRLQEARQLAVLQRAEQVEKQALAQRRQADEEVLVRQRVLAAAEVEALRLAKLEERLRAYPLAAQYEWQSAQLTVANALAGNTRAVLQVGNTDDIVRALVMRDFVQSLPLDKADNGPGDMQNGG
jgi:regulator of protease activity HflC (stomatin/prohibitin superfamily)